MSAADRFLKKKRQEMGNGNSMLMSGVAPSMASRHGLDQMGGYDNSVGRYTGKGPDNVAQPQLPTQRRMTPNGQPYVVDENELLVIDSKTLEDFGGPEALEQFIQQNRPSRTRTPQMNGGVQQYACGGTPKQYYGGGVPMGHPQYNQGGVPTRQRGFPSQEQLSMLNDVKQGVEKYQEGGTTEKPQDSITRTRGTRQATPVTPKKDPFITNPDPFKTGPQKHDPLNITTPEVNPLNINPIITAPDVNPLNIDPVTTPLVAPDVDPLNIPDATPYQVNQQGFVSGTHPVDPNQQGYVPDGSKITDPVQTDPVTGEPIYAPSNVDEMMWNRYLGRMGAQQEAQRAGAAQRGLQAGMSDREIAGRGAIDDISRREAMGGATSDFAIDAAQRAEAKDKWQQTFDFTKKKYGDLEGGRIAADIAAGMTFDQIKAKYPNMTQADYQSMKDAGNLGDKEWDKKMLKFDTLIAAGDYTNAEAVWKDMFPDTPIDFQKLIDEGNMDSFNTGMGQMTKYISSGLTWDEALAAMKKDGTLSNLGLSEKEAHDLYDTLLMKSSKIWQITNAIDDDMLKEMFPDKTPEEARAMITKLAMFGGMTLNDDGTFDIDEDIMKELFGDGSGTGTGDYTYADYKKDAEAGGDTPLTESDWEKGGSKKYETKDYSYDDYKKAAEEAGQVPMQEDEWNRTGANKYETKSTVDMFDDFMENVPDPEKWDLGRWERAGRPSTYDAYKTKPKGENTQKFYDKYKDEGWGTYKKNKFDKTKPDDMDNGREKFLTHPEDVMEFGTADEIGELTYDELVKMFPEQPGMAGENTDPDIYAIGGINAPLVLSSSNLGSGEGEHHKLVFYNLDTGNKVWVYIAPDGSVKVDQSTG